MQHLVDPAIESKVSRAVFALAVMLCLVGVTRRVIQSEDAFTAEVIIDDALYYLVPARNLIDGNGFSFDGEHRTSGVQPLWAVVVTVLAAFVSDDVTAMRLMVLLSGVLWVLAGVVLHYGLRRFGPATALLIATGWMLTGFWNRVALQGMENGLHGLLFALLIAYGVRHLHEPKDGALPHAERRFFLGLGVLVAFFTLTRVECGVLAVVLGVLIWLGLIRPGHVPRLRLNWRGVAAFVLPGLVLIGAWLVVSKAYFGSFTPISGRVKQFYENKWEAKHADVVTSLGWHAGHLCEITASPVADNLEITMWRRFNMVVPAARTRVVLLALVLTGWVWGGLRLVLRQRMRLRLTALHVYAIGLTVFVAIHFAMFACLLPHFTPYGSWYFSPEFIALWVVYATGSSLSVRGVVGLGAWGRARHVQPLLARVTTSVVGGGVVLLLLIGLKALWYEPAPGATNRFVRAARWMNEHLEPGRRIGTLSSGFVGLFASKHQVYNLDGLMNDEVYFEQYLRSGRIRDYLRHEGIEYFADYQTLSKWREGVSWVGSRVPLESLRLARWWRLDGNTAYCIWRVLPDARTPVTIGPADGPRDRVSEIQFEAAVLDRYPVVGEAEWQARRSGPSEVHGRVVTSIVLDSSGELEHVVIPRAEVDALGLSLDTVDIAEPLHVVFGEHVELLGVAIPRRTVGRGQRLVVTRFWTLHSDTHAYRDASFEMWINPSRPETVENVPPPDRLIHKDRGCHGTHPIRDWRKGELVVETYSIPVPRSVPPGTYPLMLGIRDPEAGWLTPHTAPVGPAQNLLHLGDIEIR